MMPELPIAAQLYTVRDQMAHDFEGTLRAVAGLGYDGVEFAGLYNRPAEVVRALLDELGLRVSSAHVPLNLLEQELDEMLATYRTLGCPIIVVPWLEVSRRNDYAALVPLLLSIAERVHAAGMRLAYHNHDFELAGPTGATGLDTLKNATTAEQLQFELDCGWVYKAGQPVVEMIESLAGRLPLLHIKDVDGQGNWIEAGRGKVGYEQVVALAPAAGVEWLITELDVCPRPPLESLDLSLQWLRAQHSIKN